MIQFPWRLVASASFFLSCSIGIYLSILARKVNRSALIIMSIYVGVVLMLITQGAVFQNQVDSITDNNYVAVLEKHHNIGAKEYLPSAVPSKEYILSRGDLIELSNKLASAKDLKRAHNRLEFDINTPEKTQAILPLLYYEGYKAELNGIDAPVKESRDGLVQVDVSSGHVVVWYTGTFLERAGLFVSLSSLFAFCCYLFYQRRKNTKSKMVS